MVNLLSTLIGKFRSWIYFSISLCSVLHDEIHVLHIKQIMWELVRDTKVYRVLFSLVHGEHSVLNYLI